MGCEMRTLGKLSVGVWFGLLLLLSLRPALAVGPETASFNYARTLWRVSDGLPEDTVQALAESHDGLLWIGTTSGLTRFDGAHMKLFGGAAQTFAANSIFCIAFAPDGSLWAGTEGGGLLHVRNGAIEVFARAQGLTDEFVRSVAVDHLGRVWVGTDDGLFVFENGRLRRVDGTAAIPALAVHSIIEDRDHRIWAGGSRLIAIDASEHEQEFKLPGAYSKSRVKKIFQSRDGTVWVGTVGGLERLRDGQFEATSDIHATVRSLLETTDGTLWIGTIGDGLWTWRDGQFRHISSTGLLPSDTVLAIFEDGQQQVWIGTQAGLVRLNKTPVSVVELPEGGDADFETISGDASGDVWVAAQHLYRVRGGAARQIVYPELSGSTVRNVFTTRNGDLWLGTDGSGAYRMRGRLWTHYTAPGELTNNFIRAFLESHNGDIWIATDEGVSRIGGEGVHQLTEANGLAFFSTRSLLEDSAGNLWIGTDRGLSRWAGAGDGDHFEQDAATRALAREKVWSILEDRTGTLWFGTRDHGLFRYRGGALEQFTVEQGLPSNSIYQILQDRRGVFWLSGPNTIASIPEAEMQSIAPHADRLLSVTVYAMPFRADGAQMYGGRQPAGWLAPDDSVWFATTRGAARVAHAQQTESAPPRVSIEEILEDGRSVPLTASLVVPSGVARLSFAFTALSLRSQKGVRFRYKLENFDSAWNSPASDRIATYTNLRAGRYKLRVVAFDTAHPSAITEVDLDFTKQPVFYQTWWFFTLAVLTLGGIAGIVYRLRVRRIQASFAAVLEERSRLAREMHDTVIQGCTGISALLEAVASLPPDTPAPGNELLDYARLQARTTIDEARQAVWNMRHERENDVDLIESLQGVAQQTAREFGTRVDFRHEPEEWKVGASAAHEVLMTVREAIYNSIQHSGTKLVELTVHAHHDELSITVADHGCGMPQAAAGQSEGHYGIIGMRERMQRLGAQFELTSAPGDGTRIELRVRKTARGELARRS